MSKIFVLSNVAALAAIGSSVSIGARQAAPGKAISGRWRMDTASIKGDVKPTVIEVVADRFRKDGGDAIEADGRLHPFSGDGYVDERSISIKDDWTVEEVDKVRGKLAYTVEYVVSRDGSTLVWHIVNYTNPNGQPVRSETVQRRAGPVITGAHLIAGKWERVSVTVDSKSDWILKLDGGRFSWRMEEGTGYDAQVGGKAVPIEGDNSGALAQITRPRPDTVVETDFSAKGERQTVLTMRLAPDGTTMLCAAYNIKARKTTTFVLHRVTT